MFTRWWFIAPQGLSKIFNHWFHILWYMLKKFLTVKFKKFWDYEKETTLIEEAYLRMIWFWCFMGNLIFKKHFKNEHFSYKKCGEKKFASRFKIINILFSDFENIFVKSEREYMHTECTLIFKKKQTKNSMKFQFFSWTQNLQKSLDFKIVLTKSIKDPWHLNVYKCENLILIFKKFL